MAQVEVPVGEEVVGNVDQGVDTTCADSPGIPVGTGGGGCQEITDLKDLHGTLRRQERFQGRHRVRQGCHRQISACSGRLVSFFGSFWIDGDDGLAGDLPQLTRREASRAWKHQLLHHRAVPGCERNAVLGDDAGLSAVQGAAFQRFQRRDRTVVISSASRTRIPAVTDEIRNAAPTSAEASDTAASATNISTLPGVSSPVMQFLRASRAASLMGSPATNGLARAARSRIWTPASSESAFSAAWIASTSAAPDSELQSTVVSAASDVASAGAEPTAAQSMLEPWFGCVASASTTLTSNSSYVRIIAGELGLCYCSLRLPGWGGRVAARR